MKVSIFISILLLFLGCLSKHTISKTLPQAPTPLIPVQNIDLEIRYDNITYILPCKFFKYDINFTQTDNNYKGLKLYASQTDLVNLLDSYDKFKDLFNEDILERSKTIIRKGEVNSTNYVIEEISTTVKDKCLKFTFEINRNIFNKRFVENDLTFSLKSIDRVIKDYNSFKLKYNKINCKN